MKIFPAIDLYSGKAVRLYKGNYDEMTVYSDNPAEFALDFKAQGAKNMHLVDLEGARSGETPNLETVKKIVKSSGMFVEVGGGVRSMAVIEKYLDSGVGRVILGTSAVNDRALLESALARYGEKIAVGVDIRDGFVAIKGWTEKSSLGGLEFCKELEGLGVATVICTDVSRDGAMRGTNLALYKRMKKELKLNVIASGGVTDIGDITALKEIGVHGAIIGKAYYTGKISVREAIEVANDY